MSAETREGRAASPVRERLHEAAVRLFAEHGISGTSLQMIADDVGVTKAALYYHYKTKEELVLGAVEPIVDRLGQVIRTATLMRGRRAQVEVLLEGLTDVVVQNRQLYLIAATDPAYAQLQQQTPRLAAAGEQLLDLLCGPDPSRESRVTTMLFLSGLVGPLNSPLCADVADEELRAILAEKGRQLLLSPRRTPRA